MKCCEFKSGMLRTPFTLSRQVAVQLEGGAEQLTYVDYATGKCAFKSLSGGERLYAERIDATTKSRAIIRYRSGIAESDRLTAGGRVYNIRFINNIELRNRWIELDLDGGVSA